jgi:hypothetical protein
MAHLPKVWAQTGNAGGGDFAAARRFWILRDILLGCPVAQDRPVGPDCGEGEGEFPVGVVLFGISTQSGAIIRPGRLTDRLFLRPL